LLIILEKYISKALQEEKAGTITMNKEFQEKMNIQGLEITVVSQGNDNDYISLTDIARKKDGEYPSYAIQNWLRNKNTLQYLGVWENLYNPDFNSIEFDGIMKEAGTNGFIMTPKRWIEKTNAIGLMKKVPSIFLFST
jgi:hypothetical protein